VIGTVACNVTITERPIKLKSKEIFNPEASLILTSHLFEASRCNT